jgi:hypothetical protein
MKFKFRFSYWLLIGLIGFLLQITAFFISATYPSSASSLTTTDATAFWTLNITNWFLLFGSLLVGTMFVGYFVSKRDNDSTFYKISTLGGALSQFLIAAMTITYFIFAGINRTKMFSSSNNQKIIETFMMIRVIAMLLSSAFNILFIFSLRSVKNNNSKAAKVTYYIALITNTLLFVMLFVVMIMSLNTKAYEFLTQYINMASANPPYATTYPYWNGFTLLQMNIQLTAATEASTYVLAGYEYSYLVGPAVVAFITEITYLINIAAGIVFVVVQIIESFDLDRDNDPMHI